MTNTTTQRETDEIAYNAHIIQEFRQHNGKVGGQFEGAKLVVLGTTGARSGEKRFTPLAYLTDNGRVYVFAAGPYAPHHPHWYHNLVANSDVTVELGTETFPARVTVVAGPEQKEVWNAIIARVPHFAGYLNDPHRQVPVIALDPTPQPV